MTSKSVFGIGAVIACALAVALQVKTTLALPIVPVRPSVAVQGATKWVAFSASAQGRQPSGLTTNERFFRDSSGNSREEITAEGRGTLITINNYERRMIYVRGVTGEWAGIAMPSNMRHHGPFATSRAVGQSATPEDYAGLRVYRVDAYERSELRAPSLNFFAVWRQTADETKTYSNIVQEEQPPDLFLPPPGVSVEMVSSIRDLTGLRKGAKPKN